MRVLFPNIEVPWVGNQVKTPMFLPSDARENLSKVRSFSTDPSSSVLALYLARSSAGFARYAYKLLLIFAPKTFVEPTSRYPGCKLACALRIDKTAPST